MAKNQRRVGQHKSQFVSIIPRACAEEAAAVELMEAQRWGDSPTCAHCDSANVYKMVDAKTGKRNKRYLWRCRDCKKQYTVRIGTVFEESRIPMRHWCYAFWRACTSKKGVAALEIQRQTGLSYKSALFMMHRIRFAMLSDDSAKLEGTIEADETYVGGKPRNRGAHNIKRRGHGTTKTPVVAVIQRGGAVKARVVPRVNSNNLRAAIDETVAKDRSRLMTDDLPAYRTIGRKFRGGHKWVQHNIKEYARGDAHVNTAESFFSLIIRGIYGVYHNVSKKHLHRYVTEFEFRFTGRKLEDGDRTAAAIRGAVGKRLYYRQPG